MSKVLICNGCSKVSDEEYPEEWLKIRVKIKLVQPEVVRPSSMYTPGKYDSKKYDAEFHFCSTMCVNDYLGRLVADEYVSIYPSTSGDPDAVGTDPIGEAAIVTNVTTLGQFIRSRGDGND